MYNEQDLIEEVKTPGFNKKSIIDMSSTRLDKDSNLFASKINSSGINANMRQSIDDNIYLSKKLESEISERRIRFDPMEKYNQGEKRFGSRI